MEHEESNSGLTIVGGMNVPAAGLRFNATSPLARLRVSGDGVALEGNGVLRRVVPSRACRFADLEGAEPVRGWTSTGVAFRLRSGAIWYFWTRRFGEVLMALAAKGVPTRNEVRKVRYLRSGDWPT